LGIIIGAREKKLSAANVRAQNCRGKKMGASAKEVSSALRPLKRGGTEIKKYQGGVTSVPNERGELPPESRREGGVLGRKETSKPKFGYRARPDWGQGRASWGGRITRDWEGAGGEKGVETSLEGNVKAASKPSDH